MISRDKFRINTEIRSKEVLVIGDKGEKLGVLATSEAVRIARNKGLDLVEVAPASNPPVCRIMDYGKYKYQQQKKAQEAKKKQKTMEIKTVKVRPRTDEHDLMVRVKQARQFIEKGNKVKVVVMFRGREQAHVDIGKMQLDKIFNSLSDIAIKEKEPVKQGRDMTMVLAPKKYEAKTK